MGNSLTYRQNS